MSRIVTQRASQAVLVLVASLSAVFFVGSALGDPVNLILGIEAPAERRAQLREELGLDDPLLERYVTYMSSAIQGDFGRSYWQNRPAMKIVLERLPATGYLAAATLAVAIPGGLALGIAASFKPDSVVDRLVSILSMAAVSVVEFWIGLMLILLLAVHVSWLPTGGYGTIFHVMLPALALAFRSTGRLAQMTRSSLIQELQKPYVTLAKAKGLSAGRVHAHAMRNALLPVVTLAGDETSGLLGGSIVVETVFSWPGIGRLVIEAISNRDLFVLQAAVLVITGIVVTMNLLVDLSYHVLNPRVREAAESR